jgi:flagellar L-ring protein precursor FlgH
MFGNGIGKSGIVLVSFLMVIICVSSLNAISLWNDNNGALGFCSEVKGLRVGDIVNVIIVEKAIASQKSTTKNKKATNLTGGPGTGPLSAIKSMGLSTASDFQGNGQTSQSLTLSTRVTARVMKVFPNGNMLIEGKKESQINNEVQKIYVKGIIRPVDVTSDNVVYSTMISDAEIKMVGKGSSSRTARPGLLHKVFDWVFNL